MHRCEVFDGHANEGCVECTVVRFDGHAKEGCVECTVVRFLTDAQRRAV